MNQQVAGSVGLRFARFRRVIRKVANDVLASPPYPPNDFSDDAFPHGFDAGAGLPRPEALERNDPPALKPGASGAYDRFHFG